MRNNTKPRFRFFVMSLAILVLASSLPAYIDQLSEEEVRQAYDLAQRHDQDVVKFFKDYESVFPGVLQDTHVSRIGVRTPFYSVVQNSFERGSTYSFWSAREAYAANPYPFFVVVDVTVPFATFQVPAEVSDPKSRFWKQFDLEVTQNGRIAPRQITALPLFSPGGASTNITGGELLLEFDVRDIASKMIEIRVAGPATEHVTAGFDLDKLR